MTKEELIQCFTEGDFSEVSRENVLLHLFQNGQITYEDFLELQKFLEYSQMPVVVVIKEPIEFDTDKWLEYSKPQRIEIIPKDNNQAGSEPLIKKKKCNPKKGPQ